VFCNPHKNIFNFFLDSGLPLCISGMNIKIETKTLITKTKMKNLFKFAVVAFALVSFTACGTETATETEAIEETTIEETTIEETVVDSTADVTVDSATVVQ
jgi:hypothetical protein